MEMSRESQNGSFEEFLDPGDALNSINERQVFERASCIDPDADNITSLLHTIVRLQEHPFIPRRVYYMALMVKFKWMLSSQDFTMTMLSCNLFCC